MRSLIPVLLAVLVCFTAACKDDKIPTGQAQASPSAIRIIRRLSSDINRFPFEIIERGNGEFNNSDQDDDFPTPLGPLETPVPGPPGPPGSPPPIPPTADTGNTATPSGSSPSSVASPSVGAAGGGGKLF